ncbi:unnamed protein product [Lactuca virosa]|uniref:Uncharacterized protein n=1 Tax=Lactuca virosa TaxID=75947 RepID=A0AAU9LQY1_9ASTR|nr:unnamed protein product [Lactuca virosa]
MVGLKCFRTSKLWRFSRDIGQVEGSNPRTMGFDSIICDMSWCTWRLRNDMVFMKKKGCIEVLFIDVRLPHFMWIRSRCQLLGFDKFIPSYATATNKEISIGVNYGSGGSGIRKETGSHMGDRYSMDRQLLHHKSIISRISRLKKNTKFLRKCIYIVNIGSNDYINNYYMPDLYNTSHMYTKRQYAKVLINQYSGQLKSLYSLGGRKIAVFSLAPIGCSPIYINKFGTYGKPCVQKMNEAVTLFNDRLKALVHTLNHKKSDAKFTFINLGSILSPLGDVPMPNSPCCLVRKDGQCIPKSIPCPMRSVSIFFDGLHPTEVSNNIIATRSYSGVSQKDASPYDISQLAQL